MPLSITGKKYILVFVDIFTRFVILRAIPNKKAITIARQLVDIFLLLGFPKIIQSDNGLEFVNGQSCMKSLELILTKLYEVSGVLITAKSSIQNSQKLKESRVKFLV